MRVAFVVLGMAQGGAERVAAQLTQIWSSCGIDTVLLSRTAATSRDFVHDCIARETCQLRDLTPGRVAWLQAKYGFDCAVFNDAINAADFRFAFESFGTLKGVRRIVINHHPSTNWLYTLSNWQEVLGLKDLLQQADALVCVDAIHALWWQHLGCRAAHLANPFALGFGEPKYRNDGKVVVWAGRIFDYCKQFDLMIDAFNQAASQDGEVHLRVLGRCGAREKKELLKRFTTEARARVEFTGFVSNPSELIGSATLYAFTSNSEATIPQVVLEANALGIPIIAYDIPDLRELSAKDGVVKIPEGGGLGRAILELLNSKSKLNELSENAISSSRRRAETIGLQTRWKEFFRCVSDGRCDCAAFLDYRTEENMGYLLDEIAHAEAHFVRRHLPQLLSYLKLRKRLSLKYLLSRIGQKLCK